MKKNEVKHILVTDEDAGRRIDNFLIRYMKGVPKSRLYQMLRRGEVRVNSTRIKQTYRLAAGDSVRMPPVFLESVDITGSPSPALLSLVSNSIVYEDEALMVLNKPSGLAVHSGSGRRFGVIETLRALRPETKTLELVHRLDAATSGCLLIAKDSISLRFLHSALKSGHVRKIYLALVRGQLENALTEVQLPLSRNLLLSGERMVQVREDGKHAITRFRHKTLYPQASLVDIELMTGRTHQIRVHAAHIGHPLAGDEKYGDREFNKYLKRLGLSRLFLHALKLQFESPSSGQEITISAPLSDELQEFLCNYEKQE